MRLALPALPLVLAACTTPPIDAALTFSAHAGGAEVACGDEIVLGSGDTAAQLADARLFVSNVQLRDADGVWVDLLLEDSTWQNDGVALLDFEDGTAGCADSGTADLNDQVLGTAPDGSYDAVRFDVGLPFEKNHIDSATAPSPLNAPGMFWVWRAGYKFVRVDFMTLGDTPARWNVHVGSTGCVADAPTQAPTETCGNPNLATITLTGLDPLSDAILLNLDHLVQGVDITANTADTPPGCMSEPTEPDDCEPAFSTLGLSFAGGDCVDGCSGQSLFTTEGVE